MAGTKLSVLSEEAMGNPSFVVSLAKMTCQLDASSSQEVRPLREGQRDIDKNGMGT